MALEDLKQYGSDSGFSDDSPDSDAMPNSQKQSFNPNATSSESEDDRSAAQKFDWPSDSDEHTPAQKSKWQKFSPIPSRQYGVGPSDYDGYDELYDVPVRERKTSFRRPHIHWETVSSWALKHVVQDDID